MENKKKPRITSTMQNVAIDVLNEFAVARTMDDVVQAFYKVMERYDLHSDPFTGFPVTFETFCKNSLERNKQEMIARYGHCDGLE